MLSDAMIQKAIDVPLMDGVPLLISDQKYLCKEVIRLRSELARFREGMPTAEDLETSMTVLIHMVKADWVKSPSCIRVGDWLRRLSDAGGEG